MKSLRSFLHFSLGIAMLGMFFAVSAPARAAGTTITVNSTTDNSNMSVLAANTTCDLREAVAVANTNTTTGQCTAGSAPYTIAFNVGGGGARTITLADQLSLVQPVTIDGTTQPGFSGTPLIRLDGSNTLGHGLIFGTGSEGSLLKSLMITRFTVSQVLIQAGSSSSHVTVIGCYIGTDGTASLGGSYGLEIIGGQFAQIGGLTAADRNVISGNTVNVVIYDSGDSNVIQGNYIGPNVAGTGAVIGSSEGVFITKSSSGAHNNRITRNVISGNAFVGVYIVDPDDTGTLIDSNFIGTDASGSSALGVAGTYGIAIGAGDGTMVGGTAVGAGNVISNNSYGISVSGTATNTKIFGNRVGTDKNGTSAIGNTNIGIDLAGAPADIGDSITPGNNLISGNFSGGTTIGIDVSGAGSSGTTIYGNKIGVNLDGTAALPNDYGIYVQGGGSPQIAQNWVANNTWYSVILDASSTVTSGPGGNCFTTNGPSGLTNLNTGVNVDFSSNWWGNATGPTNGSNPGGSGDIVSDHVNYTGFVFSPTAACSPRASLSAAFLTFGNQLVGSSATKTITLTNGGGKRLTFTSIKTTGPYGLTGSTCPLGSGTLAPGAHCLIKVKFSPIALGPASKSVTIKTDAPTSPDSISLTGTGVAGTQLLKDPGFEADANHDNKPDNWSLTGFNAATDSRDCTVHQTGSCSLKLAGNGTQKSASETIMKSGVAGNDFTFSLWSRAAAIPAGSVYQLQVSFYNGAALKATRIMKFAAGTHGFQKVGGTFTATSAYTKVVFKITLKASSGTAWFDSAALHWAP